MRQEGYYWVKDKHEGWIIAEWCDLFKDGHYCFHFGNGHRYDDSDFEEIDEKRIERVQSNPIAMKNGGEVEFYGLSDGCGIIGYAFECPLCGKENCFIPEWCEEQDCRCCKAELINPNYKDYE